MRIGEEYPPLTRERRRLWFSKARKYGITPAHAGKTRCFFLGDFENQDHPRLRGKDLHCKGRSSFHWGSPPLTRERLYGILHRIAVLGITPAHAGTTIYNLDIPDLKRDHPRSRGNDRVKRIFRQPIVGSPPLTRERHLLGNLFIT